MKGNKVVTGCTLTGMHDGEDEGIATTGKRITLKWIRLDFMSEGKLVETWNSFDRSRFLEQVGLQPIQSQQGNR